MKSFVHYNLFQHIQVFFVLVVYFNYVAGNKLTTQTSNMSSTTTTTTNVNSIECSNNYALNEKHFKHKCNKFNAEYLMAHTFDVKVSDDIDMDPCKSGKNFNFNIFE